MDLLCSQNQDDVHGNQLQKRNWKIRSKLQSCILWWWPSAHFSPWQSPLLPSSWGRAASFTLGNITINQKLLIWQDVVDKESSLDFPGLQPLWQRVTQLFPRGKEIQTYRSWHLGWRSDRQRCTGGKPCTEQQKLVSAGEKKKARKACRHR